MQIGFIASSEFISNGGTLRYVYANLSPRLGHGWLHGILRKCFVTLEIPRHPLRLMHKQRRALRRHWGRHKLKIFIWEGPALSEHYPAAK